MYVTVILLVSDITFVLTDTVSNNDSVNRTVIRKIILRTDQLKPIRVAHARLDIATPLSENDEILVAKTPLLFAPIRHIMDLILMPGQYLILSNEHSQREPIT